MLLKNSCINIHFSSLLQVLLQIKHIPAKNTEHFTCCLDIYVAQQKVSYTIHNKVLRADGEDEQDGGLHRPDRDEAGQHPRQDRGRQEDQDAEEGRHAELHLKHRGRRST